VRCEQHRKGRPVFALEIHRVIDDPAVLLDHALEGEPVLGPYIQIVLNTDFKKFILAVISQHCDQRTVGIEKAPFLGADVDADGNIFE